MNNICTPLLDIPVYPYLGKLLLGFSWMLDHDGYFSFDIKTGDVQVWGDFICFKGFATEENLDADGNIYENDIYMVHGDERRLQQLKNEEPWHPWNLLSNDGKFNICNYGFNPPLNSFTFDRNSNIYNPLKYATATRRNGVWEGSADAWKGTSHQVPYPRLSETFRDRRETPPPYRNFNTNILLPSYPSTTITFYGLDHGEYNAKYNIVFSIEPDIKIVGNIYYILPSLKKVNNTKFTPNKGVKYA